MANGYVCVFKLNRMSNLLDKIRITRKKYGNLVDEVKVDNRISIKFNGDSKTVYVLLNENKYVRCNLSRITELQRSIICGLTLGIVNQIVDFETNDKTVMKRAFVNDVCDKIEENMGKIEEQFKKESNKNWR